MAEDVQKGSELREVSANKILAEIKNGEPIDYDRVRIVGDLDISKLNLPLDNGKFLISPIIKVTHSIFDGVVNFFGSNFQNNVDLSFTKFTRSATFCQSVFTKNINFINSQFDGSAHFYSSHFDGRVAFMGAQFGGLAWFYDSTFKDDTYFYKSRFNEDVLFEGSEFLKIADFSSSKIREKAIFKSAKFKGDAKFILTKFGGFTFFNSCSFSQSLNLEGSNIYAMFLQEAIFKKDSTILLEHSEFFKLMIPWKAIQGKFKYDGSVYLALIKNYNNLEWFDDADNCFFRYKLTRYHTLQLKDKIIDFISFISYGYGVKPEYPLAGLILIFFVSAILYSFEAQTNLIDTLGISAVVLTTTNQISGFTETCKCWSIIERILGWLLMSTFLVALGKKTIR